MASRRRKVVVLVVLLILIAAGVGTYLYFRERDYPFTVSKETTFLLGPLNSDGTVNYVAALNEMLSEGVTPENNAAVLLVQALGPEVIPEEVRAETLDRLGIPSLPKDGTYFVDFETYLERNAPRRAKGDPSSTNDSGEIGADDSTFEEIQEKQFERARNSPWSGEDFPLVAEWLKVNEKPLALVAAACKRPRYYVPLVSTTRPPRFLEIFSVHPSYYYGWVRALSARSMLRLNTGDIKGTCEDLLTCHRLARLVSEGPTIIDRLVGFRFETMASDTGQALAASGKLGAQQVKNLVADMQRMGPLPGLVEPINYCERFLPLDLLAAAYRRKVFGVEYTSEFQIPNVSVNWNKGMRTVNSWYDRGVAGMRKETFPERNAALAVIGKDLLDLDLSLIGPSLLEKLLGVDGDNGGRDKNYAKRPGAVVLVLFMDPLRRVNELHDCARMRFWLAQVALALAGYKAERGEYPETLSELTPKYFKEVPEDLFVNEPLKYERVGEGYLLYSVGPDMRDDGGKEWDRDRDAGDLVIRAE